MLLRQQTYSRHKQPAQFYIIHETDTYVQCVLIRKVFPSTNKMISTEGCNLGTLSCLLNQYCIGNVKLLLIGVQVISDEFKSVGLSATRGPDACTPSTRSADLTVQLNTLHVSLLFISEH
jgi:hypothetical protein